MHFSFFCYDLWPVKPFHQTVSGLFKVILVNIVKPFDNNSKVLKGCNPYHDEFHLDGTPFLAHQRGSMKHQFKLSILSKNFYFACEKYLNYPKWSTHPSILSKIYFYFYNFYNFFYKLLKKIKNIIFWFFENFFLIIKKY